MGRKAPSQKQSLAVPLLGVACLIVALKLVFDGDGFWNRDAWLYPLMLVPLLAVFALVELLGARAGRGADKNAGGGDGA